MITGTTPNGFDFEIDEKKLNDMRMVELLADAGENAAKLPKVATLLLGSGQKERLYKFLETEDGNVPIDAFMAEFLAIMESSKDTKKS